MNADFATSPTADRLFSLWEQREAEDSLPTTEESLMITATPHRVTGSGLISLARDFEDRTKSSMVAAAGYVKPDGKLAWTDFYTALIEAKGDKLGTVTYDEDDYDSEWCKAIAEFLPNVDEIDARDTLAAELEDIGISNEEQLKDCFEGCFDGWRFYEEFGKTLLDNMGERVPEILLGCIDYERLWEGLLKYDYNIINFAGDVYVFNQNY